MRGRAYQLGGRVERVEPEPDEVVRGKGRILVMDDDPLVQQIVVDILRHLGYDPLVAANGHEVLEIVEQTREADEPLSAIILDLTVPGSMGGLDAKKHLEQVAPDIPVIVSSGYSNDPVLVHFHENGFAGVALKPFNIQKLSVVLRDAMGPRRGSGSPFSENNPKRTSTPYPFESP